MTVCFIMKMAILAIKALSNLVCSMVMGNSEVEQELLSIKVTSWMESQLPTKIEVWVNRNLRTQENFALHQKRQSLSGI